MAWNALPPPEVGWTCLLPALHDQILHTTLTGPIFSDTGWLETSQVGSIYKSVP